MPPKHLAERLWSRVDTTGDCWLWTGHVTGGRPSGNGYGAIALFGNERKRVTHAAWFLSHGEWPAPGQLVCHHCDNPRCVRPSHLFVGNQTDNMRDMYRKGRQRPARGDAHRMRLYPDRVPRGECHSAAKVNAADVLDIRRRRANGETLASIGKAFGLSATNVCAIVKKRRWAHVS